MEIKASLNEHNIGTTTSAVRYTASNRIVWRWSRNDYLVAVSALKYPYVPRERVLE